MVRRLHQNVATVVEAEGFARFQLGQEVRGYVKVAATDQAAANSGIVEVGLEAGDPKSDVRPGIVVHARKKMRSTRNHADAACY